MLGDVAFAQAPFASQGGNTFNVAVSETGSIDSFTAISSYIAFGAANESASALAVQSTVTTFVATNSESASGSAVFNTLNNIFNVALLDGASGIDGISVQTDFAATVAEAVSAVDALLTQTNFVAAIAEAASGNAIHQGGLVLFVSIGEAASGLDATANNAAYAGTIQEFASGLDNLTVIKTLNASVTGVQLVVRVGNILIWSQINDNQDPNWQNISNSGDPGWVIVPS
jgi:uncharacterized protein YlxP (DUF503 family)